MSNPLSWSGINYILVPPSHPLYNELNDKPMVDSVNPFSLLGFGMIDHAALSFYERLVLTNRVFMGKHFDWYISGKGCKGIIDILIFPLVSRILLYHAVKTSSPAISRGAAIVGYSLEIARRLTSILLTIAVSPLVALVHIAFKLKNKMLPTSTEQSGLFGEKNPDNFSKDDQYNMRSMVTGVRTI